ncbi:MAG: hypothetical protein ACPLVJ_02520 [Candidatus Bathyarchaeales archaeon]
MKAKRKKEEPKRFVYDKRLIYASIASIIIVISVIALFFIFYPNQPSEPKAAIIDQLSSSYLTNITRHVNETFVENAKTLLYKRFSKVDYYSDNATIENYKDLASLNYKFIVWRAHSALDKEEHFIAISSSERSAPQKYQGYLENGQVTICNISGEYYFGITPKFVEQCMSGRFEDTVIVFMSCNGLNPDYTKTAETFVNNKGVKAFISWDGWIEKVDNDNAVSLLLKYLIEDNRTIYQAVKSIPPYGLSSLDYYPHSSEVENYHIPNYKNSVSSSMMFSSTIILRKIER